MLKILSAQQNQQADAYTMQNKPILSINLMENAAKVCSRWIINKFSTKQIVNFFAGPGNNGGDALAMARLLSLKNYNCRVYLWGKNFSEDNKINQKRLEEIGIPIKILKEKTDLPRINTQELIVEGIFGSGLKRPVGGFAAEIITHINLSGAEVISIDIPSGLFAENNTKQSETADKIIISANVTLSIEMPFLSLLLSDNQDFVGNWEALSIGLDRNYINAQDSPFHLLEKQDISSRLLKRKKNTHKGTFGHCLLIVGSEGKFGAAVLSCKAALKSGLGLLTAHIPSKAINILQTAIPECMLSIDSNNSIFTKAPNISNYASIGIGCGIGKQPETVRALKEILQMQPTKLVLDADALNILSENSDLWKILPQNTILTPHPKEFERLFGTTKNAYERLLLQQKSAKAHKIIIILKGANTCISDSDGNLYFNTTGNNGMATAGSGDVLTGFLSGLLASGYKAIDAALVGVYLHGLAGDCALTSQSFETLIASDIINNFSMAFKKITNKRFNLPNIQYRLF